MTVNTTLSTTNHGRQGQSARVGFTLVELLVVIGIIALLISILLPSLAKAREAANSVACLSNIRQLGAAIRMYAEDNKGFLPAPRHCVPGNYTPLKDHWGWLTGWSTTDFSIARTYIKTQPRAGANTVFRCPSDSGYMDDSAKAPTSYGLNTWYAHAQTTAPIDKLAHPPRKISSTKQASRHALMVENYGHGSWECQRPIPTETGGGFPATAFRHNRKPSSGPVPNPSAQASVVFMDGHAELRNMREMPNREYWYHFYGISVTSGTQGWRGYNTYFVNGSLLPGAEAFTIPGI